MFGGYSVIFGRVAVMVGSARKTYNYLLPSLEGFECQTSSTLEISWITVSIYKCFCTNFRYLHCHLHWCFKFALVF